MHIEFSLLQVDEAVQVLRSVRGDKRMQSHPVRLLPVQAVYDFLEQGLCSGRPQESLTNQLHLSNKVYKANYIQTQSNLIIIQF
jgi:hypothetical protein